ncbi:MAG: YraN family protein [Ruminococcaceae bacterium]|nr:YraN family protein [Oscillospiraceae bacterium]
MELQSSKRTAKITGTAGENAACDFLVQNGYRILHRNYRVSHDEIDIIAENDQYIVFVEVKTRTQVANPAYGRPAAAVTAKKRFHLARAAEAYIKAHKSDKFYRFDVIEVLLCHDRVTGAGRYRLNHMKGVFGAKGRIWV